MEGGKDMYRDSDRKSGVVPVSPSVCLDVARLRDRDTGIEKCGCSSETDMYLLSVLGGKTQWSAIINLSTKTNT